MILRRWYHTYNYPLPFSKHVYHFKFHDASHKVQVHGLHHTPEACSAEKERESARQNLLRV